ncbi:MAG: hypothetical protein KGZ83_11630 [Sulfuricella sp.]|nr:hypothetical protein [Sulfuricella sp.]
MGDYPVFDIIGKRRKYGTKRGMAQAGFLSPLIRKIDLFCKSGYWKGLGSGGLGWAMAVPTWQVLHKTCQK